ncbi:YccV-like-domain-containing protein [Piedraia hortae CBS 480.64]|uniref:YccV-like-domain-containing protein n=1 Tax=Piedraia hortae CBS 480.64 TaxID=1314780 RepID=A0A6A7BQW8_9PEZI|nr:YccV-like-domain-containing protein [Piedraia hortae CBS 480.64]
MATGQHLQKLPEELIDSIARYLSPEDTAAFGATCRLAHAITNQQVLWRKHCVEVWKYWNERHVLQKRLKQPLLQTEWRELFLERKTIDRNALQTFSQALKTQRWRTARMGSISSEGYDVKDVMLWLRDHTPEDAEDYLARTYHANLVVGAIHRRDALGIWFKLRNQPDNVSLEEALGAFDTFVLSGRYTVDDIKRKLDSIAAMVRAKNDNFDKLSPRKKALLLAEAMRTERIAGIPLVDEYHDLRNNFISLALFEEPFECLPLQSAAIYCAVAKRLGLNAMPSNFPEHVLAVIEAQGDFDLDGKPMETSFLDYFNSSHVMYMDPSRSSAEVDANDLSHRLAVLQVPPTRHSLYMRPAGVHAITLRVTRNIIQSIQITASNVFPNRECAWYAMLWSILIIEDPLLPRRSLTPRRTCLVHLDQQVQEHFPEDSLLFSQLVDPTFRNEYRFHDVMDHIKDLRDNDGAKRRPCYRTPENKIKFQIGTVFIHRRYHYQGVIVGWDPHCSANSDWITHMGVDLLPGGRGQPFYNVVAADHSSRYVAEENILPISERPCDEIMMKAGKWFKRWDKKLGRFVSNIRDDYPDD